MRAVATMAVACLMGAGLAAGAPSGAEGASLKMQASWPASLTLYENFQWFAQRVGVLTGGKVEIQTMPAGQVVPAFEVLDATNAGVIDGAHTWAGYWQGKNKTGILFTGGPGGNFGMDYVDYIGWMFEGGGFEMYQEYYRDVLKLNIVALPILPSGPQAFGWFKRPIESLEDFKAMKCRQTGIAAEVFTAMGMTVVNMPGGEIIPAAERGVIDCAEWIGGVEDLRLGFQNVWKYHYTPGMHESVTVGEIIFNGDVWNDFDDTTKEIIKSAAMETWIRWWAKWQRQNADAIRELTEKYQVQILKTPDDILIEFLKAWDKIAEANAAADPFFRKVLESKREYASFVVPAKRLMFPPYSFAANYYWPEKTQ